MELKIDFSSEEKSKLLERLTENFQDSNLFNLRQTQDFFGVSRHTLYVWRQKGILPYIKIGGKIYIRKSDCLDLTNKIYRDGE